MSSAVIFTQHAERELQKGMEKGFIRMARSEV